MVSSYRFSLASLDVYLTLFLDSAESLLGVVSVYCNVELLLLNRKADNITRDLTKLYSD